MAQRYRTERDGNIDPGYWNPDTGGRQGQRDAGPAGEDWRQRRAARGDSRDYSQAYDENAEGWRRSGDGGAGYGNRGGGDERRRSAPPDLEYDQGWHSNADWSGEGDTVPRQGRGMRHRRRGADSARESSRRDRGDDEGNYLGQGWDRDSDLFARGGTRGYGAPRGENWRGENWREENWRGESEGGRGQGARGTEGRDWRGAQQTTGRDYFGHDDYRRDYGGFVEPDRSQGSRRTSPYSGSSAGYVTGDAFGDESWSGAFIGGTGRDDEREYERGARHETGRNWRGAGHRGKGPKGYARSAERIREEVCERLSDDDLVDASEISITCGEGGVMVLEGTVDSMAAKHRAEMIADQCTGVRDVDSRLKVARPDRQTERPSGSGQANAMLSGAGSTGGSETGSVGRQDAQGQQTSGSRSASSASMMAASRDAEQDRQKH